MKVCACLVLLAIAANAAIDIIAPSTAFEAAGNSVPPSIIEDQPSSDLQRLVVNETALYIKRLVNSLSREISVQSLFFARSIGKHAGNFERSVRLLNNGTEGSSGLDWSLKILNELMQDALSLIPKDFGGGAVSSPVDVPSEVPVIEAVVKETNHSLHDLINNAPVLLDAAVNQVLDFQMTILKAGLSGMASTYPQLHKEFRTLACKEHILPDLQRAILTVQENAKVTKENVQPENWKTYEAISERAMNIFSILE